MIIDKAVDFQLRPAGMQRNRWAIIAVLDYEPNDRTGKLERSEYKVATLVCDRAVAYKIVDMMKTGLSY